MKTRQQIPEVEDCLLRGYIEKEGDSITSWQISYRPNRLVILRSDIQQFKVLKIRCSRP